MLKTLEVPYGIHQSVSVVLVSIGHTAARLMDERYGTQRYLSQNGVVIDIYDDFEEGLYSVSIYTK